MKTSIAAFVSSALVLPIAAQAVNFEVSGHVNRAVIVVGQNGTAADGDVVHVDASSSETRFRFTGSEDLEDGLIAGFTLERGKPDTRPTRHANVSLSNALGTIAIGQASEATDGVANTDLGGSTWLVGATNWCSYGDIGPVCLSNDGNRNPVLRYDTPAIGPAKISAPIGNYDYWDATLTVAGSIGDSGYDVRVGYKDDSETTDASAGFSMGQGTSVAVAWGQSDDTSNQENSQWGVGVSYSLGGGATAYAGYSLGGGATAYLGWRHSEDIDSEDIDALAYAPTVL